MTREETNAFRPEKLGSAHCGRRLTFISGCDKAANQLKSRVRPVSVGRRLGQIDEQCFSMVSEACKCQGETELTAKQT